MSRTANQIRGEFIQFFEDRGHTFVPSCSLLPADDPTLLFTNAGMNQFKDVFLGAGTRPYTRAASSQKCIRAGGKHNDLEDVGHDTFHQTFFEMLGNWSFGDYFKAEAIEWAWELLTGVWGLPKDKLWATVFGGGEAEGIPADEESRQLWPKVTDLPAERVLSFGMDDNFWEMGETGPCGVNSEIHIDLGPELCDGSRHPGAKCSVNVEGCGRFIELWNLVFIQFNRDDEGVLTPLPAKHVDTGLGFERICARLQGVGSNYDTDVFTPLIGWIESHSGVKYGAAADTDIAFRAVADHARACSFAIADGILPSNEGRGYVVRRILRRAARFGRNLGQHEPFLHQMVPVIVEQMGGFFPELAERRKQITATILDEEESFNRTLDEGIKIWWSYAGYALATRFAKEQAEEPESDRLSMSVGGTLAEGEAQFYMRKGRVPFRPESKVTIYRQGDIKAVEDSFNLGELRLDRIVRWFDKTPAISGMGAFELYATYGFPVDLTAQMASECGLSVDMAGYEKEMARHREISSVRSEMLTAKVQVDPTAYVDKYKEEVETRVIRTCRIEKDETGAPRITGTALTEGDEGIVFLSKTPFYAESGGQAGDRGTIEQDSGVFEVMDTRREIPTPGIENYCHYGRVTKGHIVEHVSGGRRSKKADAPFQARLPISGAAKAIVDQARRMDTARNHTATHLLNWSLRKVLGDHVDQRGSVVDPDRLRFDFTHGQAASAEELAEVERLVNEGILADQAVGVSEVPLDAARKIAGVRAVFGETYPDPVRVISVGVDDPAQADESMPVEFCGGTHLDRTSQVGLFKIISEESVAKGVRRITAVTGRAAVACVQRLSEIARATGAALRVPVEEIPERVAAMQAEIKQLRKRGPSGGGGGLASAKKVATAAGEVLIARADGSDAAGMRKICDVQRQKGAAAVLLAGEADGKVVIIAMVAEETFKATGLKAGDWVKEVAAVVGGKGGGKPTMAQAGGRDVDKLPAALDLAEKWVRQQLAQ